jgi:hypothetical protein
VADAQGVEVAYCVEELAEVESAESGWEAAVLDYEFVELLSFNILCDDVDVSG